MEKDTKTNNLRQLTINRLFNAPRDSLWQAWTDSSLIQRWWGPKDFTAPVVNTNMVEGGDYLYCMRAPDSKDYWSKGRYLTIDQPNRTIVTDSFADAQGNIVPASYYHLSAAFPLESIVVIEMQKIQNQLSKLTIRYAGIPSEDFENAKAGWLQSLEKLAAVVEQTHVDWLRAINSALAHNDIVP
jgi:uncharacterized protein YndB with AHSA1/START domain